MKSSIDTMLQNRGTKYKKSDTLGKHMFKLIKNVAPASTLIKQNDAYEVIIYNLVTLCSAYKFSYESPKPVLQ